jgi:hypothetical protein
VEVYFPSLALRGKKLREENHKTKQKSFKAIREQSEKEVEQVKRATEIILCWCANNYDHFHIS